ncbi:MAG: DUF2125 domain-containing protein [Brevirhabdus sp.]
MTRLTVLKTTSALALALSAGPALADLTAEQAWEKFQSFGALYGGVMTAGSKSETANGLEVSDIALTIATPEFEIGLGVPDITLVERGDGAIEIVQPDASTLTITLDVDGEGVLAELGVNMPGAKQIVREENGQLVYDFALPTLDVVVNKFVVDGEEGPVSGTISMKDYNGSYKIGQGDVTTVAGVVDIANVTAEIKAWDPDGDGNLLFNLAYQGFSGQSAGSIPAGVSMADPSALMSPDFKTEGGFSHQGGSMSFSFVDGSDQAAGEMTSEGGSVGFAMNADSIGYDLGGKGLNVTVSGSEIPLPMVSFGLEDWAFGLLVPTSKSEEESEFGLLTRLGGLTVNDMMWMMVDPAGALPHDPATFELDLTGTAKLFFDLFNPESLLVMEQTNGMPGELNSLNVKSLLLSAMGAKLSGDGAFTFDNADLATFGGFPRPEGKLDLELVGANALIDKLVGMGLLPEDQAMGARMMMGLFARPGGGEDTLVSTIEVTPEGAVMANGQRLR